MRFIIENSCLNCLKIFRINDYEKTHKKKILIENTKKTAWNDKNGTISPAV